MRKNKKPFISRTFINSFHYLYQDAEYFRNLAHRKEYKDQFDQVQFSRTAILLYVLSLEALINKSKEKELVFPNTKIPKDPYSILPEHLDTAIKVVDDIVKKLDELLDGKILKDNWYKNESWELIYPPGAKLSDI
ncbi:MAG: hypothetical protein V3U74_07075, partial [Thermodesulfobacteriota bacterium]